MTTQHIYPRPMDTRMILEWSAGEPLFTDPSRRDAAMEAVKITISRLGLPDIYEALRRDACGIPNSRPPQTPTTNLLRGLLNNLRFHGYIYPTGPVPDGATRPPYELTPITPHQMRVVREYARGGTQEQICARMGVVPITVQRIMARARDLCGVSTNLELMAYVYWSNWLPGKAESVWLERSPHPIGPGFGRLDGQRP